MKPHIVADDLGWNLCLIFNAPHTPYQAPQEYIDRYPDIADPTRRTYAGMVACLEDEIGRAVRALEKRKMRDNTIILFHGDNGGTRNAMFAGVMADMSNPGRHGGRTAARRGSVPDARRTGRRVDPQVQAARRSGSRHPRCITAAAGTPDSGSGLWHR